MYHCDCLVHRLANVVKVVSRCRYRVLGYAFSSWAELVVSARQVSNRSSQHHRRALDAIHHRFAMRHRSAECSPAHQSNAVCIESILTLSFNRHRSTQPPTIKVRKEHGSPNIQSVRLYPCNLSSLRVPSTCRLYTARPLAPLIARDSAGLTTQDVGPACLSSGF